MCRFKTNGESGSAILEFIAVILVGQIAILAGTAALSQSVSEKLKRQSAVVANARAIALGSSENSDSDLCSGPLVCVSNTVDGHEYRGVSYQ